MKEHFYELTYIINPVLDEDKFKETVSFVQGLIEQNKGSIEEADEWGVRPLAYDIDGKSNGYYVNLHFSAPAEAIEKIERNMRIHDDIMRYLTIKYDSKMIKHRELVKKGEKPTIFDEEVEEDSDQEDN